MLPRRMGIQFIPSGVRTVVGFPDRRPSPDVREETVTRHFADASGYGAVRCQRIFKDKTGHRVTDGARLSLRQRRKKRLIF